MGRILIERYFFKKNDDCGLGIKNTFEIRKLLTIKYFFFKSMSLALSVF